MGTSLPDVAWKTLRCAWSSGGDHRLRNLQGIHQGQYRGYNSTSHHTVARQPLLVSHGPGQGLARSAHPAGHFLLGQTLLQLTQELPGKPAPAGRGPGLRQGLPAVEKVAVRAVVPVNLVVLLEERS